MRVWFAHLRRKRLQCEASVSKRLRWMPKFEVTRRRAGWDALMAQCRFLRRYSNGTAEHLGQLSLRADRRLFARGKSGALRLGCRDRRNRSRRQDRRRGRHVRAIGADAEEHRPRPGAGRRQLPRCGAHADVRNRHHPVGAGRQSARRSISRYSSSCHDGGGFIADRPRNAGGDRSGRDRRVGVEVMKLRRILLVALLLSSAPILAQSNPSTAAPQVTVIRAGMLIDPRTNEPKHNQVIVVCGDKIGSVGDAASTQVPAGAKVIDLSNVTVLPGLIESHTHIFLQGEDPAQGGYDIQLLKFPLAYRAARATVSARRALEQGFTTIRDMETEGAGYGDVGIKMAVDQGYIPGPRMFV